MTTRILLVDDHTVLREGLASLLDARSDLSVVGQASDGLEGVELAERLVPDVTIMDIWLPRLSGIEATAQIVRRNPRARVIILSVHEKQSMVSECFRAGAAAYVVKTACTGELLEAIAAVGRGRSYLSPAIMRNRAGGVDASPDLMARGGMASLTRRERQVLQLIAEGRASREIARDLHISTRTVESHRAALMRKLGVNKVSNLVRLAIREELVAP